MKAVSDFESEGPSPEVGFPSVRLLELLSRIEAGQRLAAHRLAALGRHDAARTAEESAEALRFALDSPTTTREMFSLRAALRRLSPLDRCCEDALAGALSLVGADRGNIQLGDKRTGALRIAAQEGFDTEFLEYFAVVNDDGSACGRAAKQRSQTVIADVNSDPAFGAHREIAAASGFRAVCSTPLLGNGGKLVGIISTHYSRPYRPSQRELETLERYGRLVGPVLAQKGERIRLSGDGYVSDMGVSERQLAPGVIAEIRRRAAAAAENMADQADRLASMLEEAAPRGDATRRLWVAHQERLISAIERRNAARLRQAGAGRVTLEPLPRLFPEPDGLPKLYAE